MFGWPSKARHVSNVKAEPVPPPDTLSASKLPAIPAASPPVAFPQPERPSSSNAARPTFPALTSSTSPHTILPCSNVRFAPRHHISSIHLDPPPRYVRIERTLLASQAARPQAVGERWRSRRPAYERWREDARSWRAVVGERRRARRCCTCSRRSYDPPPAPSLPRDPRHLLSSHHGHRPYRYWA